MSLSVTTGERSEFLAESTGAYVEDLMDLQTVVTALNKPPYNYGVTAVTLRFVIYALDVLLEIPCRKSTTQA